MTSETIISITDLSKDYISGDNVVHALRSVNLEISQGEFVAIMGPSGSGKSTFMNILGCLDRPTSGKYLLSNQAVANLSDDELADIRSKYIGFVFQSFYLLPKTPAIKNVELPLEYAGVKNRTERALAALERVGLGQRIHHKPSELSGGQQQRVAIARAIVNNPVLILADEPTGNLDSRISEEILAVFQDLNRQGKTIVVVTHEEEIARHCKRVVRFKDGRLTVDEQIANPVDAFEVLKNMPDPDAPGTHGPETVHPIAVS